MSSIQLLVGLANPGKEYQRTRHNAGAWLIDIVAMGQRKTLKNESKFHGLFTTVNVAQIENKTQSLFGPINDDMKCHLLIPTTYMNLSGKSVIACMKYFKLTSENILIVHDDIDLPVGTIKLKYDGGDGGHNGLKDIINHLHTKKFLRLRIGVGRPVKQDVVDYVLEAPSETDLKKIYNGIQDALKILPLVIKGDTQKAMHRLHTENNNGT